MPKLELYNRPWQKSNRKKNWALFLLLNLIWHGLLNIGSEIIEQLTTGWERFSFWCRIQLPKLANKIVIFHFKTCQNPSYSGHSKQEHFFGIKINLPAPNGEGDFPFAFSLYSGYSKVQKLSRWWTSKTSKAFNKYRTFSYRGKKRQNHFPLKFFT